MSSSTSGRFRSLRLAVSVRYVCTQEATEMWEHSRQIKPHCQKMHAVFLAARLWCMPHQQCCQIDLVTMLGHLPGGQQRVRAYVASLRQRISPHFTPESRLGPRCSDSAAAHRRQNRKARSGGARPHSSRFTRPPFDRDDRPSLPNHSAVQTRADVGLNIAESPTVTPRFR